MMTALTAVVFGFAWIGVGVIVGSIVGRVFAKRRQGHSLIIVVDDEDIDAELARQVADQLIAECGGVPPKEAP